MKSCSQVKLHEANVKSGQCIPPLIVRLFVDKKKIFCSKIMKVFNNTSFHVAPEIARKPNLVQGNFNRNYLLIFRRYIKKIRECKM